MQTIQRPAVTRAAFLSAVRRVSPELWLEHDRAVAADYDR